MLIDAHVHIMRKGLAGFYRRINMTPFTVDVLLKRMDAEGIEKSVLLPLDNADCKDFYWAEDTFGCIKAARRHPDRLIAFCCPEPRGLLNSKDADFSERLDYFKSVGCVGIGELTANLSITNPKYKNLFYHAGRQQLPVLIHITKKSGKTYGAFDKFHLPGLEEVLKEFPETIFIGHALAFWSEIDHDLKLRERETYPKSKIAKAGALCRLLDKYPNLYADLSAGSGFNAINRDLDFGLKFLDRYNHKLLLGTDRFHTFMPFPPIIELLDDALRNKRITRQAYDNITHLNFTRIISN